MCTLIALHRCVADSPLVVAANRDEFHERPTEGPALRTSASASAAQGGHGPGVGILAPLDLRAGGTWLGLSAAGVFAAVTNRRAATPDPDRRSRGWLVLEALAEPSARSAADRLECLGEAAYNPFNLFVADGESAHLVTYAERPERIDLAAGPHVIGNLHPGENSPKLERLRGRVREWLAAPDADLGGLEALCREHADTPLESTCVHAGDYGTGSSTLLRTGAAPSLRWADGPPCKTPYRDLTPLLRELGTDPSREGNQERKREL